MEAFLKKYNLHLFIIIIITFICYLPAIQGGFIWDDDDYVTNNKVLRAPDGLSRIFLVPKSIPQYYPLVHAGFWVEYQLWGLWPMGYHIMNILIHSLAAIMLYQVLKQLDIPGAWWAAAIFALHPVHVESAAWITERKNVLSGLFYMISALFLVRYFQLGSQNKATGSQWRWYVAGLVLFICALLSKTVTCSLPAAIMLVLWWKRGSIHWKEMAALVPFFLLGIGLGLYTAWLEHHHVGAQGTDWSLSFIERCLIAGRALWFYAGKLAWPADLIFVYPRWNIDSGKMWQYIRPVGILLVVQVLWVFRSRIGRGPLAAVLFFAGTLFPALGFIDVYPFVYSYVADHFQYLASVGLITLGTATLACMVSKLRPKQQQIAFLTGILVIVLYGLQTWNQCHMYKNLEILWTHTLKKNPAAFIAHNNLGSIRIDQERFDEAIEHFSEALRLKPDLPGAFYNMGIASSKQEKMQEAVHYFSEALRVRPVCPDTHLNIGVVLYKLGKNQEAFRHFSEALRFKPNFAEAHYNMGAVLNLEGKAEEAVFHYSEALRINPDYAAAHYNLGFILIRQKKYEKAALHFSETIRIAPSSVQAHRELGRIFWISGYKDAAFKQYEIVRELNPEMADDMLNRMHTSEENRTPDTTH
ncbi:MAG: tetratricopeptide repeat protein [Desulfobacterales bacterium]|nr:tetratricopeptide repeat protein [Desulfobacterales bacterium]